MILNPGSIVLRSGGSPQKPSAYAGHAAEPSTITDFNGFVGVAHVTGNGTRTDAKTSKTKRLFFDTDVRFMDGHYIGVDGQQHGGTFSFF